MSLHRKIAQRRTRRALRVRKRFTGELPRVSVFRSLSHIYAQLIDDKSHVTLASCSSQELENLTGDKTARAFLVGKELAQRVRAAGIERVAFDRGRFLYHGRIKALADGLREGGLTL